LLKKLGLYLCYKIGSCRRSYENFFLRLLFFAVKLCHFTINDFFLYVTNTQVYQQKTEKFFVSEEKSSIGSATGQLRDPLERQGKKYLKYKFVFSYGKK
jgi:hypothetical protein